MRTPPTDNPPDQNLEVAPVKATDAPQPEPKKADRTYAVYVSSDQPGGQRRRDGRLFTQDPLYLTEEKLTPGIREDRYLIKAPVSSDGSGLSAEGLAAATGSDVFGQLGQAKAEGAQLAAQLQQAQAELEAARSAVKSAEQREAALVKERDSLKAAALSQPKEAGFLTSEADSAKAAKALSDLEGERDRYKGDVADLKERLAGADQARQKAEREAENLRDQLSDLSKRNQGR